MGTWYQSLLIARAIEYNLTAGSSVGESIRLISGRSMVRVHPSGPLNLRRDG
jgi:hypothetical protein